ncbi:ATP-dependent RNA helicase dbp6 [Cladophialophora chaetospira]|uniref:ATP-dependent RNA helicase n=1 Tax=Cladophialophora chaetospira TaxID=386627 RepID=A0AA39CP24_9EURO|nr:ATP-dependent RNA helicase dbp6 [Cladophialophora chaetospira]
MSRFYARYVPPTKKAEATAEAAPPQTSNPDKRKREEDVPQAKNKKLKTSKVPLDPGASARSQPETDAPIAAGNVVLSKYRVTESAKSIGASVSLRTRQSTDTQQLGEEELDDRGGTKREQKKKKQKNNKSEVAEESGLDTAASDVQPSTESQQSNGQSLGDEGVFQPDKTRRKKKAKLQKNGDEKYEADSSGHAQKHASVLSKFEKAKQQDQQEPQSDGVRAQPSPELHGLEPIPQPELVNTKFEAPSYSVLPPWQENPLIVPLESNADFTSFGLSEVLMKNLRKKGLARPLPVQETVLPLLLDGPARHAGDLCVSAATGSGKTLSYVLPVIADLKDLPGTKLRAVIVVPTRELVKQVYELCEACSAGTSLKFVTAVGSKSLSEEQEMLVKEEKVYDPDAYQKWQRSPIDWSTFSLASLAKSARDEDPLESYNHVTQYRSKVDVLIATPGRLVDHLTSTPGFTLDHVRWLVVDEADRLLNESYQEWVAVVRPALESQAATQKRDDLLRQMRMTPPRRSVTKVLLSATMTRDLSKLNALGLHNPKLVVLGGHQEPEAKLEHETTVELRVRINGNEAFHLPETLKETAIPITDGSQKPLFLLELVRNCIGINYTLLKPTSGAVKELEVKSDSSMETSSDTEDTSSSDSETSSSSESFAKPDGMPASRKAAVGGPVETPQSGKAPRVLIFTRSTASAERLSRLLCILDPHLAPRTATLTRSTASSASSRRALASFRNFRVLVLIATDRASRGLDVPGLEHVVSYDVPNSALTYVHRVGRTARAGMGGQAWTLVEHREGAWYWREIGGKGKQPVAGAASSGPIINRRAKVSKLHLSLEHSELKESYEAALKQLGEEALGKSS